MTVGDMARSRERAATAHEQFDGDGVYLNTASLGLPPRSVLRAVRAALEDWQHGRASPPDYDEPVNRSRAAYARLVSAEANQVAVGSQVSAFAGLVAAGLPDGSEVLTVPDEFTSIVFPFLAQAGRGVTVREVPLEALADAVTVGTALVSVSAVQSADGRLADLDAIEQACAATGTQVLLDTTQAVGWLPVDAGRFAYTTGGGYKWLLAPRGTAFFTVRRDLVDQLVPHAAGWYAGQQPWTSIYGSPLRLAPDARRFDLSPAWHSWVGQAAALDLLTGVGREALHEHALGLANRFRDRVGLPPGNSAIVSLAVDAQAGEQLARARITVATRAGRLRLGFHVNNTAQDADRAAQALRGHLAG